MRSDVLAPSELEGTDYLLSSTMRLEDSFLQILGELYLHTYYTIHGLCFSLANVLFIRLQLFVYLLDIYLILYTSNKAYTYSLLKTNNYHNNDPITKFIKY